jgi:hypothetical protein
MILLAVVHFRCYAEENASDMLRSFAFFLFRRIRHSTFVSFEANPFSSLHVLIHAVNSVVDICDFLIEGNPSI